MNLLTNELSDSETEVHISENNFESSHPSNILLNEDLRTERVREEYFAALKKTAEHHVDFYTKLESANNLTERLFGEDLKGFFNDASKLVMPVGFNPQSVFYGCNGEERVRRVDSEKYRDMYYDDQLFYELK